MFEKSPCDETQSDLLRLASSSSSNVSLTSSHRRTFGTSSSSSIPKAVNAAEVLAPGSLSVRMLESWYDSDDDGDDDDM